MAFTIEVYIDPSLAPSPRSPTSPMIGAGTIGDPYDSIETALALTTPAANTRFNIKSGGTCYITQNIATTYAAEGWTQSTCFQGYDAVAGDGGIGVIDGGGNHSIWNGNQDIIYLIDLKMGNVGDRAIIRLDDSGWVFNCEIHDCGYTNITDSATRSDQSGVWINNYIHDVDMPVKFSEGIFAFNRVEATGIALQLTASGLGICRHNIITTSSATANAVELNNGRGCIVDSNSIYSSAGGSGSGIHSVTDADFWLLRITNNLIEGFSGSGGHGINYTSGAGPIKIHGNNSIFNCETAFTQGTRTILRSIGADETLSESPFVNAAGGDFTPKNVGGVFEGHKPTKIAGDFF